MKGFGEPRRGKQNIKLKHAKERDLIKRALAEYHRGDLKGSKKLIEEFIKSNKVNGSALGILATIERALGDNEKASLLFEESIRIDQNNPDILHNYSSLMQEKDLDRAIELSDKALAISPNNCSFLERNSYLKWRAHDLESALKAAFKVIKLEPNNFNVHRNMGNIFKDLGRLDEALSATLRSVEIEPKDSETYKNLALIYREIGNLDQALAANVKSLEINPNNSEVLMNQGIIYRDLGSLDNALTYIFRSIEYNKNYAEAYWNASQILLLSGDYEKGWQMYEYRFQCKQAIPHAVPLCKKYNGNDKMPHTLLIISEQGLGDTLLFMRYIKLLRDKGISISFCAELKLHSLVKISDIDASPLTNYEAKKIKKGQWMPLLSVPKYLEVSPRNPIIIEPYIKTSEKLIEKWRCVFSDKKRPIIGINWKGNRKDLKRKGRDIPIEHFKNITRSVEGSFLSFQRCTQASELKQLSIHQNKSKVQDEIHRLADSDDPEDFLEYAAIIKNCDLVITNCSTLVHLAGGMGVQTWIVMEKIPNWQWGLYSDKSCWYPSARLFRQKNIGEWQDLIFSVVEELKNFCNTNKFSSS